MIPRAVRRCAGCALFLVLAAAPVPAGAQESLADLLDQPGANLRDPAARARVVAWARQIEDQRRARAREQAAALGLPLRVRQPDGTVQEIVDFMDGEPVYFTTHNANAAISTAANLARSSYAIDGNGVTIGMWDGGAGRASHQEFGGRMVVKDGAASIDHATHVGGTLIAAGVVGSARGMSPAGTVDSYDWNNDTSEMASRGATGPGQAGMLYLSNHSYGIVSGWRYVNDGTRVWEWYGNGTDSNAIEEDFGRYNSYARDQDSLACNAPYYLIFRSAGNERDNNPSTGQNVTLSPGSSTVVSYDPASHPPGDGVYRGGFETIAFSALGKNVLTVGAVNDAVTSGTRDPSKATLASFSSWGPTDDGRIKPDVVANGVGLYSPLNGSDSSYGSYSGTSMSTPNAAGSAALLIEHYATLFSGGAMRSATLKGLLIHTADDRGNGGPDYKFGWGLVDTLAAADLLSDHEAYPDKQRLAEDELTTSVTSRSYPFVWDGVSPIRATLCWTDPPGNAASTSDLRSPRLVNNLDLKVIAPGGAEYFPYVMPFVGNWSQASMDSPATTGLNNTDNVEQVYVAAPPAAGTYQIVVSFSGSLTDNSQEYSLLLSGSADEPPPPPPLTISAVSPASALPGPVTLELSGTGFQSDTAVKLTRTGYSDLSAGSVTMVGETLVCDFDLAAAAAGLWDVVATNPDSETYTLPDAFTLIGAIWSESFDGSSAPSGWTSQAAFGSNSWTITTARSHSPTKSYFAPAPSSKTTAHLSSPGIPIPSGATDLQLKFWHHFDLESGWDGGRIGFSLDGGSSWFDVEDSGSGAAFASNGYNTTIFARGKPTDRSEFEDQRAWSGSSNGFLETIVNLTDTAKYAGRTLQVRWSIATNQGSSSPGWYVDSVALVGGGDIGNQPPTILSNADSSSTETETDLTDGTVYEVVRGAVVNLTVTATDDGGEAGLTYAWSVSDGPGAAVFFSPNGNNAAKLSTASFEALGDYRLSVAVSDPEGLTVSSDVNVRVVQQDTSLAVTPEVVSLVVGSSQAFSATMLDQFGNPMASQPSTVNWTANGGGSIDMAGVFTATNAGGPFVVAANTTIDSTDFTGNANVTVNPAPATVTLGDLAQTYDGSPKPVSVTTDPAGLAAGVTYDGSSTIPTDAGSYAVLATVTDPNYQGDAADTLMIAKATATVILGNLAQTCDGSPKPVSVTTTPTGLAVDVTYDGSPAVPAATGSYAVVATVTASNYQGGASDTLVISPQDFAFWQDQHFTELEQGSGLADPTNDADLDGLLNLLEYALGTNPRSPDSAGIEAVVQQDGMGVKRLSLVFSRPAGRPDLEYVVQAANLPDAPTWETVTDLTVTPDDPPETETVTAWDPLPHGLAAQRFMRLRVSLVPAAN